MRTSRESTSAKSGSERLLAELLEQLTERVQAGHAANLEELLAQCPEHAEEIRRYLPALHSLAEIDASTLGPAGSDRGLPGVGLGLLGDFRLLREVGRGGMGVVYEAEQLSLGRRVALKVLPFAAMLDERRLQRFKNEAHAAAVLQHPHIVPVYGVGCERGVHYYAMQLIDGCSLAEALAERAPESAARAPVGSAMRANSDLPFPPGEGRGEGPMGELSSVDPPPAAAPGWSAQRTLHAETVAAAAGSTLRDPSDRNRFRHIAELGIQAAMALAYAHAQGVIHRDIKPSNLLIDRAGKLWVTDFGLARLQADGHELTLTGDVLGTLRYMSPEQLSGEQIVDERTDVYSLGLTLYELLAGRPAFGETARERLIGQILNSDPPPLRKVDAGIPRDLETIAAKALAKDRDARYASARALADDLHRYLERKPILARPSTRREALGRWARRNPTVAALSAVLSILLTLSAVGASLAAWRLADVANRERLLRADTAGKLRAADLNRAKHAIDRGDLAGAVQLLEAHAGEPGGFESDYLAELCRSGATARVLPHNMQVVDVTFAPGGNLLCASTWLHEFQLWDYAKRQSLWHERSFGAQVTRIAFRQAGQQLVSASRDGDVRVWDVVQRKELYRFSDPELDAWAMDVSPTTDLIAIGYCERYAHYPHNGRARLVVWDPERDAIVYEAPPFREKVLHLKFSPDGRTLAMATYADDVRLFDTSSWRELPPLGPHAAGVFTLAFSRDGKLLASGGGIRSRRSLVGEIKLWNTADWSVLQTYYGHSRKVYGLAFLPDNRTLLSGAEDSTLSAWDTGDLARRTPLRTVLAHSGALWDVDVSPDGAVVATAGTDNAVRLWSTAELVREPENPVERADYARVVIDLAFADEGRLTCTSVMDGTVVVQDAATGVVRHTFSGRLDLDDVQYVAVSDPLRLLAVNHAASPSELGAILGYDYATGERRWQYRVPAPGSGALAFDRSGRLLAVGTAQGIDLLDASSGRLVRRVPVAAKFIFNSAFSPDGRWLACASWGRTHLVDTRSWQEVGSLESDRFYTFALDFSPDGAHLATGGSDGAIRIWNFATGELVLNCRGHADHIYSVEYSPDGRRLLSGAKDRTVRIFDPESGECLLTLSDHDGWVFRARWSPDGKTVASCGEDRTVILRHSAPRRASTALPHH